MDLTSGTVLWRRPGGIQNLAYSHDGQMVAVGGSQSFVQLLDSETGEELDEPFHGHTSWVARMIFFDNDQTLVTCGADQTVRVWDVATGRETNRLIGARNEIWTLKAIPDTSRLVSGGKDGKVILWDRQVEPHPRDHVVIPETDIAGCASRPDGSAIVTLHRSGEVKEWRSPRFESSSTLLKLSSRSVVDPALSLDGNLVAIHDQEQGTQVWSVPEQRRIVWPQIHDRRPVHLIFAPDHRLVIVYPDWDRVLVDPRTGKKADFPGTKLRGRQIDSFARSPSSGVFTFTVGFPREDEYQPMAVLQNLSTDSLWEASLNAHEAFSGSAISWDDRYVGVPTDPGDAIVLTIPDLTVVKRFHGHPTGTKSVTFFPDGTRILTSGGSLKLFDFESEDELFSITSGQQHHPTLSRMRFSADGSLLTLYGGGHVTVWRAPTWQEIDKTEGNQHVAVQ